MSDDPVREPFANPLPPVPKTAEEIEAEREAERQEAERIAQEQAEAQQQFPPQPLTDEKVYPAPPTADPKVTHAAMSSEELEELGYDADGKPVGEPKTVEPEQPQEGEEL